MWDLTGQSDQDLISRTLAGDLSAFDALVLRYERPIYNVAYRILFSRQDAEDASVEAFVRLHAALGSFRSDAPFLPWLLKITTNVALNMLRSRRPAPLRLDQSTEMEEDSVTPDLPDPGPSPEEQVMGRIALADLEREIDNLPEAYRVPFILMYLEGLECKDIAEALGLSVGAVKTRLCRAREMLRERLAPRVNSTGMAR